MEFLRYITSFTRLKHLCCDTIFIQRCSTDPGGRLKPHGIGALRLSTLHVRKIPQDLIHALLDRTASTLESLTIASGQDVNGLSLLLSQMSRLHSLTFDIFRPRSTTSIIGGWGMVAKSLSNATIPTLSSLRVNLYEDMLQWHTAYSNTTLRPDSDINAISSFILAMKLPSFTIDIRAHFGTWHGVQPIRSTFKLMGIKLFADLCDHGLPPLVVYSGATFADEVLVARSIALSPDGERVAGLNVDGNIILWNISDDPSVRTWGLARPSPNPISSIVFSPDSARLLIVTPKNTAYICDVKRGHRLTTIACDPIVGAWSPRCIAFTTHARTISTWDPFTYQPIQDYALGGWPLSPNGSERRVEEDHNPGLLFSPDHRWLAASYPVRFSLWSNGYAWVLWRVTDRGGLTDPTSLPLPSGPFGPGTLDYYGHLVAFNLECTRMAVVGYGLKLHVWDVATATLFLVIDMATTCAGEIRGNIAFSADGRCLLVLRGGKDTVEVWDTTAGYLLNPLVLEGKGNGKPSTSESLWRATRFSPCGRYLISSPSNTGGVMVWKTTDGSLVRRIS
ncbi:hypothetical protein LXA43DRAFT_1100286 [Ganoderma leucocontextum]|nr:hypothetical protein LXA43DRAFT_1100286 [Ganoderma leucocontextum]